MASPSVTYSFSNSTTADATSVNQNFTDLINGLSDGTKDLSINAITCAGAATLNGNVTLGNATADDITVTGSLASTVNIKTTFSYDIGSATLGLKSVYLGSNDSAAKSVRLIAGAIGTSYTLTLPTGVPAVANSVMVHTTGGVASFVPKSVTPGVTASKTTTYSATAADDFIPVDTTSAWTLTLPAANAYTGKTLLIMKTTSDFNALTISRAGSDTIEGDATAGATSTTINTANERIELISDGSSKWYISRRIIPSVWTAYTPTYSASLIGGSSVVTSYSQWRRIGDSIQLRGTATAGASVTGAAMKISLPSGAVGLVPTDTILTGSFTTNYTGGTLAGIFPLALSSDTGNIQFSKNNSATGFAGVFANVMGNGSLFSWSAELPISGWKG